jgi:hypothetical protein
MALLPVLRAFGIQRRSPLLGCSRHRDPSGQNNFAQRKSSLSHVISLSGFSCLSYYGCSLDATLKVEPEIPEVIEKTDRWEDVPEIKRGGRRTKSSVNWMIVNMLTGGHSGCGATSERGHQRGHRQAGTDPRNLRTPNREMFCELPVRSRRRRI